MPKQTFLNLPADKREMILRIAIDEFAEHDYNDVSISRMVDRAGIAKGSFYQYFEDKRDLFFYLLDLASKEKLAFIQSKSPPDPQMGLFPYMQWVLETTTHFEFSNPRLARVAYRALYGNLPFGDETLRRMKDATVDTYRQLVRMGIERGDVNPQVDPDVAAFLLGAVINEFGNYLMRKMEIDPDRFLQLELADEQREDMARTFAELVSLLQHGMGVREE